MIALHYDRWHELKNKTMKKIQLNQKKLQLIKERVASLTLEESIKVNGGADLWGTRALCIASKADNCSARSCGGNQGTGGPGTGTGTNVGSMDAAKPSLVLVCF